MTAAVVIAGAMSGTRNFLAASAMLARRDLRHVWRMIRCLCARLSALSLFLMPQVAHADAIDDLVQTEMARTNTPGVAVAVVRQGRLIRAQGFGQANIELGVPVHADTLFKTGATGMQFTAAAVMLLGEDGRLQLDAPVTRYLSSAPDEWNEVTIRQLLDHTSGLPATPNGDFRADYSNAELLAIIADEDLNFPAGKRWRFSYAGYIVLGFVIEEVTGEHWTKFVERRLFSPLGMHSARGIDELAIIPSRASGYEVRGGALRNAEWISQTANSTADGSLYLSVLDYAIWAQTLSQRRLLRPVSWDALASSATLSNGATCAYAPGWFREPGGNDAPLWHSGMWQGFQTYSLRYPGKDLTVAVFANGEGANVRDLARGLAALIDPALARPEAQPQSDADPAESAWVRALVEAIAAGQAEYTDFADFALLDFTELTAQYAGMIGEMGALTEVALFDKREHCAEIASRYRARFEDGMVEIRLGMTAQGKVSNLEILPLSDWNEPL